VIVTLNHLFGVAVKDAAMNFYPRDATIHFAEGRRWGRRRASLRGRPMVRHAHRGTACLSGPLV